MTATIIAFPPRSPVTALCRPVIGAAPFTSEWFEEHGVLIRAGLDFFRLDDAEFARRIALIPDEHGRQLVGEFARQIERLGTHLSDVADALGLTAERIHDAMAVPA